MDFKTQLRDLYERHEPEAGTYAWMNENDRWAELIFCLLNQYGDEDPQPVRTAVSSLGYLGLLDPDKLSLMNVPGDENAVVVTFVLKQHGFSNDDARRAAALLARVAAVIQKEWGGKIQRYLRRHGEMMRDELTKAFAGESLTDEQLRYAVSHWLQNALSLPVSLEHQAVVEFCRRNQASLADLTQAADELNLNIALVDDLLEFDRQAAETAPPVQTPTEVAS